MQTKQIIEDNKKYCPLLAFERTGTFDNAKSRIALRDVLSLSVIFRTKVN